MLPPDESFDEVQSSKQDERFNELEEDLGLVKDLKVIVKV